MKNDIGIFSTPVIMDPDENCLAKALYDNIAETPDELAFRRGDIVTVIEQNTNGLEGWWLCSLRGKQGIAPGNRLKLLAGMYEAPSNIYQTPPSQNRQSLTDGESPEQWNRRSWELSPNKVVTPHRLGDVYVYDQPNRSYQDYDVPPSRYFPDSDTQGNYSTPPSASKAKRSPSKQYDTPNKQSGDVYDVPPAQGNSSVDTYDYPAPSNRSSTVSMLSTGSTNCSSSSNSYQQSNPDSARSSADVSVQDLYDVPPTDPKAVKKSNSEPLLDVYDTPPKATKQHRSFIEDYKKGTNTSHDQSSFDVYDTPPLKMKSKNDSSFDVYDTPPSKIEHVLDDIYDKPTKNTPVMNKSGQFNESKDTQYVYDIPPQVTRDSAISSGGTNSSSRISSDSLDEKLSRLSTGSSDSKGSDIGPITYDELPLELDAAMDLLVKLQQDVHSSTTRLLSFVSSTWRTKENLEPKIYNIQLAGMSVRTSLKEFVEFSQGALANSTKAADKALAHKLQKQLLPLHDSLQVIQKSMKNLDDIKWAVQKLIDTSITDHSQDDLGLVVSSSKELSEQVRKLASFIQGNSTLLFKRAQKVGEEPEKDTSGKGDAGQKRPLPSPPSAKKPPIPDNKPSLAPKSPGAKPPLKPKPKVAPKGAVQERPLPAPPPKQRPLPSPPSETKGGMVKKSGRETWIEDYDYVHLESLEVLEQKKQQEKMIEQQQEKKSKELTPKQIAQMERLEEGMKMDIDTDVSKVLENTPSQFETTLDTNDKQLLVFYSDQVLTHSQLLTNAIDAFLGGIEYNQPPKIFIAHSKFIVLSAHKLVYIGDTLHRNILNSDIRSKVMHCANYLCDCLKMTVTATKTAALQYPSVDAVQEMVDRVVDVSHAAHELKLVVTQAAAL